MSFRYDSPVPHPPERSKSSMCAPHSHHRKLASTANRSFSVNRCLVRKKIFSSERQKKKASETTSLKLQKVEELLNFGKQEITYHEYQSAISTFTTVISIENENLEGLYLRGMCLYKLRNYRAAIPDFLKVITSDANFNKFAYYLAAVCSERLNDIVTAIRYISKSIYHFPRFTQGFLLRGKLYNIQQRYDKALSDFHKALAINVNEGKSLLGMAESLEKIGDSGTAYRILTQALAYPEIFPEAIIQRAQLLISQNKFTQAISDFDYLIEQRPQHALGYFFKGKALLDSNEYSDSLLCFEQAIKYDTQSECTSKAVYYLGYAKVKEKDFYGAIHQLDRISGKPSSEKKLLRSLAEGVIFLIKRKHKEGISAFLNILKSNSKVEEFIPSCYEYLGFAYLSLKRYSKSLKYLKMLAGEIPKASLYNIELASGYLNAEKNDFSQAAWHFSKACEIFPNKPEPLLLQSALILADAYGALSVSENIIIECENIMNKAAELRKDSEVSFYQGIIQYILKKYELSLENAKISIEKADENLPEHYIFRGLCYASLENYQEAVNDFSVALQLNENLGYVYNFRGRCAYLIDDSDLAYTDFQKLVNLNENSPTPYIQTAVVLMHSSSFSGAITSLNNANSISYSIEAGYLKAKALILQYEMALAIEELNTILDHDASLTEVWKDRDILVFIHSFSLESQKNYKAGLAKLDKLNYGDIFDRKMMLWYKGVFLLYLEKFEEATVNFQQVIEIIQNKNAKLSADDALTIEELNCEILYNVALCYLSRNKKKALEILVDLSKILNRKHKGQILFLCALIELELNSPKNSKLLMVEAYRCDSETVEPYLSNQSVEIKPLNTSNKLALSFPLLEPFKNCKVKIKPAICLPKPILPSIEFTVEAEVVKFFQIGRILPKAEPPWLKRNKGAIMFTDNITELEHEPISHAISKIELIVKEKKNAKSGVLLRRSGSEDKESSYFQSNEGEVSENEVLEKLPKSVMKKIKIMCFGNR